MVMVAIVNESRVLVTDIFCAASNDLVVAGKCWMNLLNKGFLVDFEKQGLTFLI